MLGTPQELQKRTIINMLKASEYDQEIPQSHTVDQPMAQWGGTTGQQQSQDTRKMIAKY